MRKAGAVHGRGLSETDGISMLVELPDYFIVLVSESDPWALSIILGLACKSDGSSVLHTRHTNIDIRESTGRAQGSPGYGLVWNDRGAYMPGWPNMAPRGQCVNVANTAPRGGGDGTT